MKALGLIETRGLLVAIEGADTMLKAADVSIFDKTYVGGGLVSIAVTGDIGSVKAAVEAGVAAIKKLDNSLLVSSHVIPRPHEDLENIIGIKNEIVTIEDSNSNDIHDINSTDKIEIDTENYVNKDFDIVDNYTDSDVNKGIDNKDIDNKDININNDTKVDIQSINEDFNQDDKTNVIGDVIENNIFNEILKDEDKIDSVDIDLENLQKETVDNLVKDNGIEKAVEVLNNVKLIKLRKLARQYKDLEITDKAISKASKKLLITKIKAYYK
ncbi:BMC domain-containing protein [Clostridium sp.]|uniref:BMC domain-containing protein n=1 Tax=Clostridium sp. TaxID=1506 RepID=UPI002607FE8E|nr:BMC domain-containing protein [Clostridium sp.]